MYYPEIIQVKVAMMFLLLIVLVSISRTIGKRSAIQEQL